VIGQPGCLTDLLALSVLTAKYGRMITPECEIVTTERRPTAVVRIKAKMSGLREAQQTSRARLAEVLPSLEVRPLDHSCTLWRPPVDGVLDMEPGVLVSGAFSPVGDVVPSELPAGRAAYFLLRGSFEGLPGAWKTLLDWCAAQKLPLAGINWEIYGPSEDVEPDQIETALYALLA
jgi:effector-binding domain-containing protein